MRRQGEVCQYAILMFYFYCIELFSILFINGNKFTKRSHMTVNFKKQNVQTNLQALLTPGLWPAVECSTLFLSFYKFYHFYSFDVFRTTSSLFPVFK